MPREQVMCAAVSGGSAAGDVGLAGASRKCNRSVISGERRVVANVRAASCYVARLGSAIHGAFAFLDSKHATPALCWQHRETIYERSLPEGPGDYAQVLPHRIALVRFRGIVCLGRRLGWTRAILFNNNSLSCILGLLGIR
jgi:hypothetical protein